MVAVLLLAVAVLVGLGIGHGVWRSAQPVAPSSGGSGAGSAFGQNPFSNPGSSTGPSNVGSIAAKASAALVDINTSIPYQGGEAAGTGIVLTSNGEVLTNNHVISGASKISATDVGNGKTYSAKVVGYDLTHDIAVIQLQGASNLTTAKIGDSSNLRVGQSVVGIGNAEGRGGTPSSAGGSITALDQSITANDQSNGSSEQLTGLIQTDAQIVPGDSGGALVNTKGEVVGVDTAASVGFSFQTSGNQGFAIPINEAVSIARQVESGQATDNVHIGPTAFLGVLVDATNPNANGVSGALIAPSGVVTNGPASQAGLAGGDVITSIGGRSVTSSSSLTHLMVLYHPGDKVSVGWVDPSGQTHQATVQLGTGPPQ
ncbi:MAG: S1C family serine protease [Acidimicrobiales bacterium]